MLAFIPAPPTNGFHLGPLFFHLYGLCIALGVLAGIITFAIIRLRSDSITQEGRSSGCCATNMRSAPRCSARSISVR